jgi:hypothetical protein
MSLDIVQGDIVAFNKGYRDIVQAGETHPIDKIIKIDGKVQGIYIKLDFTWIYMSVEMFNDYCKIIRKKDNYRFCDEVKESVNLKTAYDFINPNHYKQSGKEVIDMMLDIWGKEKLIAHCEMTEFKYRMRAGLKPEQSVERDLEKAQWYANKAKQLRNELS